MYCKIVVYNCLHENPVRFFPAVDDSWETTLHQHQFGRDAATRDEKKSGSEKENKTHAQSRTANFETHVIFETDVIDSRLHSRQHEDSCFRLPTWHVE